MKKKQVINIAIVSLNDKFSKSVASSLANKLDMHFADIHEMIVYDLISPEEVIEKCGVEYLKKRERATIFNCCNFNNTVLSANFDIIKEYANLFENTIIVYLRLPEEKVVQSVAKIDFNNRDNFLNKNCDIQVNLTKCLTAGAVKKICEKLGELYENS